MTATHDQAKRAHGEVAKALIEGVLAKASCEICGNHDTQAHHDDYGRPLDVRWLCHRHHRLWHVENPSGVKWRQFSVVLSDTDAARVEARAKFEQRSVSQMMAVLIKAGLDVDRYAGKAA